MTANLDAAPDRENEWPDDYDHAVMIIASAFEVANWVVTDRRICPDYYPAYGPTPTSLSDVARRALAQLIEDGWTPPGKWGASKVDPT